MKTVPYGWSYQNEIVQLHRAGRRPHAWSTDTQTLMCCRGLSALPRRVQGPGRTHFTPAGQGEAQRDVSFPEWDTSFLVGEEAHAGMSSQGCSGVFPTVKVVP